MRNLWLWSRKRRISDGRIDLIDKFKSNEMKIISAYRRAAQQQNGGIRAKKDIEEIEEQKDAAAIVIQCSWRGTFANREREKRQNGRCGTSAVA